MKMNRKITAILFLACATAGAQVVPEATGPRAVPIVGHFDYSLNYSQIANFYGQNSYLGNESMSMVSGIVDYAHASERRPSTINYIGGYTWAVAGPSLGTGVFQSAHLSQSFIQERWRAIAKEDFFDTPQATTVGTSGVPGTGEPIGGTTGTASSSSILTINTRTVRNLATGEIDYNLDHKTELNLMGGSEILNFPDGGGLNSIGELANAGITRTLNTRTSFSGLFQFSHYSFGASPYTGGIPGNVNVNAALFGAQHSWSRQFKTRVEAGPEWTSDSNSAAAPPLATIAVNAEASDGFRNGSLNLSYNRGIVSATGYSPATVIDAATGNFLWRFGRNTNAGITGTYLRYSALASAGGDSNAEYGEALISRRMGRYLLFNAEYTAIEQSTNLSSSTPQSNILNQLYQIISFGIAFSPREMRINQ